MQVRAAEQTIFQFHNFGEIQISSRKSFYNMISLSLFLRTRLSRLKKRIFNKHCMIKLYFIKFYSKIQILWQSTKGSLACFLDYLWLASYDGLKAQP